MPPYHSISSPANPQVKDVRRALLRGALTDDGYCAAESLHLLREAIRSGRRVHSVLAAESAHGSLERELGATPALDVALMPDRLFQSISTTEATQGVIALIAPPEWKVTDLFGGVPLVVILDGIQDPGNAGTIVRAAEAFGATGILFLKGSVSPFNAKALRASAGSLFRLPFVHGFDPVIARAAVLSNRLNLYAGVPWRPDAAPQDISRADLKSPCALVIGNEGRGVSAEFRSGAQDVAIPTAGVESLNASIAAAILLYEAHRQRSGTPA